MTSVRPALVLRFRLALSILAAVFFIVPLQLGAQESAVIEVSPLVSFPVGAPAELFSVGYGAQLQGIVPFGTSPLSALASIDYTRATLNAGSGGINLVRLGGGALYDLLGVGPLTVGIHARGGVYLASLPGASTLANPYVASGLRLAIGIGDALEVALQPSYELEFARRDGAVTSFYSGITAALSVSLAPAKLSTGTRRPRIDIQPPSFDRVFPVIYKYYDNQPFGTVVIRNDESQSIRNVKVEFVVPQYMAVPQLVATIEQMAPREERQVELSALFTNDVLNITQADSLQSQVIVTYEVGGTSLAAQRSATLRMEDRNTINWDDDRKAAAFITTRDPTILRMGRNVTSAARVLPVKAMTEQFRNGVALFYALKEAGIQYQIDPNSAYAELSTDVSALDYVQFPVQTLDYRSGDCDDLSVLYSALLEGVGVPSALITIPGHIYTAFSIGMSEEEARKTFNNPDDLIFIDGSTWVPVESTLIEDGFLQAWAVGAQQWREASSRGVADFYNVAEAQQLFEPTWFGSGSQDVRLPDADTVAVAYQEGMTAFIYREIGPMIADIEERLAERRSPRLVNRLGTIYARYGLMDEAETAFREASFADYVPALINMGNVSYINSDLQQAFVYYRRAERLSPDDPEVLIGIARTQFEMEQYEEARENIELARLIDPAAAVPFAYITGGNTDSARASNAQKRDVMSWSE